MSIAVAYELPFIASECFEGIVDDELLFEGQDALAEKIDLFFNDVKLRQNISVYVKGLKEERSWYNVAGQTHKLFEKIINKSKDSSNLIVNEQSKV